jgi:hypothetical protein
MNYSFIDKYTTKDFVVENQNNLYNEMSEFVKIVNNYTYDFNNNYLKTVFTNSLKMINNINIWSNININDIRDSILFLSIKDNLTHTIY